jgi:hypothetical protein
MKAMMTSTYATRVVVISVRDDLEFLRRLAEKRSAPRALLDQMSAARAAINEALRRPDATDEELEVLIALGKSVLGELRTWVRAPD